MEDLRFSVDRSQLRGLRIYTAVAAAAAVPLAAIWVLSRGNGLAGVLALVAAICAAIGAYSWTAYAWAFTECTPAGLRTRGLGGTRKSTWPQIADISPRPHGQTITIMVTTTWGGRFRLGAPVAGGVMPDPRFAAKAQQIISYWQEMTGNPETGRAAAAARPVLPGVSPAAGTQVVSRSTPGGHTRVTPARPGHSGQYWFWYWIEKICLIVIVPALGVMGGGFALRDIGPAWAALLGHGVHGVFTATTASRYQDCTQTCHTSVSWQGTFTPAHGSVITGVRLVEGVHVTAVGQHVAGLYESGGAVYPVGGGQDWIILTLLVAAGIAAILFWIVLLTRTLARRYRRTRHQARQAA